MLSSNLILDRLSGNPAPGGGGGTTLGGNPTPGGGTTLGGNPRPGIRLGGCPDVDTELDTAPGGNPRPNPGCPDVDTELDTAPGGSPRPTPCCPDVDTELDTAPGGRPNPGCPGCSPNVFGTIAPGFPACPFCCIIIVVL